MEGAYDGPDGLDVEYFNSLLQYYFHIQEPEKLSNDTWALKIKHLEYIRNAEKTN